MPPFVFRRVPEKEPIYAIGIVEKIIDRLVVIHSFKDLEAALDEDSVLLLEDRSPIGKVYETFGPVPQPYYSVRFNSCDDIKAKGVIIGKSCCVEWDWIEDRIM